MTDKLKGPGISEVRRFIQDKTIVEFHLINKETVKGQILWSDENVFHIKQNDNQGITLLNHSIAYYKKSLAEDSPK